MHITHHARLAGAALALAAVGLTACGSGHADSPAVGAATPAATQDMAGMNKAPAALAGPAVTTDAVAISGFAFSPGRITIKAGDTVTWTNKDDEAHTVFFAFDGSRSPILVNSNNVYSKVFSAPGTYTYHCTIHPFMTGTVEVTA